MFHQSSYNYLYIKSLYAVPPTVFVHITGFSVDAKKHLQFLCKCLMVSDSESAPEAGLEPATL